jgi:hydrogenase nickel incorporation protein HypA/HybF
MHETRIACDLARMILEVARSEGLQRITRVNLKFGQMIQIVPDIFRHAFAAATEGTIAEHTEVFIEIIPVSVRCENCRKEADLTGLIFRCSYCGGSMLEVIRGKEMFIQSMEGE